MHTPKIQLYEPDMMTLSQAFQPITIDAANNDESCATIG